MKTLLKFSLLIKLSLIFSVSLYADSLWQDVPIYNNPSKQVQVGDIVTIYISESTSAVQEATTRTQKNSSIATDFLSNWDQVASLLGNESIRKRHEFEISGDDQYRGTGQTSRRSRVQAVLTATITEVLDSGNIFIVGEHKVKVNDEVETVRISGIIRPEDIRPDNSVLSYQVAKAEVSVHGKGVVGSKQTPGILTKMLNWFL